MLLPFELIQLTQAPPQVPTSGADCSAHASTPGMERFMAMSWAPATPAARPPGPAADPAAADLSAAPAATAADFAADDVGSLEEDSSD